MVSFPSRTRLTRVSSLRYRETHKETTATDQCFFKNTIPKEWKPTVQSYCQGLVGSPKPVTAKCTVTKTSTVVKSATAVVTSTSTLTTTTTTTTTSASTSAVDCRTTVVAAAETHINYPHRTAAAVVTERRRSSAAEYDDGDVIEERGYPARRPDFLTHGCRREPSAAELRKACECFLVRPTVTPTVTKTATVTAPTSTSVATTTRTSTATVTAVGSPTTTCTASGTFTRTAAPSNCGGAPAASATASATGERTCPSTVAAPSVDMLLRLEGSEAEGTIFEGCIATGPADVTTPSGGSHRCDGTNNNANPVPGGTPTTGIQDAGRLAGFGLDGTWSQSFQDFFITSIGDSPQSGSRYWGVLNNEQFTAGGGCQEVPRAGDRVLWMYDAFNQNGLLRVQPDWAVAEAGKGAVSVVVSAIDGGAGGAGHPVSGATIAGVDSDAQGAVSITVPDQPGCYQYKATRGGYGRSNAFYLNVVDSFAT